MMFDRMAVRAQRLEVVDRVVGVVPVAMMDDKDRRDGGVYAAFARLLEQTSLGQPRSMITGGSYRNAFQFGSARDAATWAVVPHSGRAAFESVAADRAHHVDAAAPAHGRHVARPGTVSCGLLADLDHGERFRASGALLLDPIGGELRLPPAFTRAKAEGLPSMRRHTHARTADLTGEFDRTNSHCMRSVPHASAIARAV